MKMLSCVKNLRFMVHNGSSLHRSAINVKNHWTTLISQECRQAWESRLSVSSGTTTTPVPAEVLAYEVSQTQEIEQTEHNRE
jgi:hypothetical protein